MQLAPSCSQAQRSGRQTARRFRPLARLRWMTLIPPLVRILARKPCVRAFFILLG